MLAIKRKMHRTAVNVVLDPWVRIQRLTRQIDGGAELSGAMPKLPRPAGATLEIVPPLGRSDAAQHRLTIDQGHIAIRADQRRRCVIRSRRKRGVTTVRHERNDRPMTAWRRSGFVPHSRRRAIETQPAGGRGGSSALQSGQGTPKAPQSACGCG